MARVLLASGTFCLILLSTMAWDFSQNLNIPRKHSVARRSANVNYTNILNFWKEHRREFVLQGKHKEVVLVMGNTGVGKSTLVSALTGRKLTSIKPKNQAYLVIVDEEGRIGTGSSSTTLIPEIMTDSKSNVTYIDCSGFRDNRNIEYEISSIYFQNILMNQVEKIKLILVINYDSLKFNGNKNDFDDLFEHIGEFIKDISKFHDGIALVATKVENIYEYSDEGPRVLLNDNQSVLDGIAEYLRNKKETYLRKQENSEKYRMFVNLIDVLLQKKNDSYSRIALFRQPTSRGLLKDLKTTKNEIDAIAKMTIENLHFVEKKRDNFGFALSQSSKITVDQIVDDIFRNALMDRLHKMGNETLTHYSQLEKQYNDIGILQERVADAHNIISRIKNVDEPLKLFQEYLDAANTLNISVSLTNLNAISEDIKKLHFFTTVSNRNGDLHMMMLTNKMQNVIESIKNITNFYNFLNNLQENLAAYNSQRLKNDNRIKNIMISCASSTHKALQDITDLKNVVKEMNSDEVYEKIKTLELNRFQLKHLKDVFGAFSSELNISYTLSSKQMTVRGYNVRMSDVVENTYWAQAKNLQILALNKIYIDCTLNKTGGEVQLYIFAPTWEVVGRPKIILDGKAGEPHEKESAKSSSFNSENGRDGIPGLPGHPAGHFFGVGTRFINSEYLEIYANGGKGGPGQHGGNGADGIAGEELPESFLNTEYWNWDIIEYMTTHNFNMTGPPEEQISQDSVKMVIVNAKPAIKPSDGGNGGVGGSGGYPGRIIINGLGQLVNIKTSNDEGSIGLAGQGGHGGKGMLNGRSMAFHYEGDFWEWEIHRGGRIYGAVWVNGTEVPAGKNGKTGSNKNNQKFPSTLIMASPYLAINSFKDFVRINLFENINESKLRTLLNKLENDDRIKTQYNTLAFVKEFEGLENQFLALRNKIDFVPFYDSFLTRIEEYAQSEQFLENKKVLNYIYTAALTKVFTLKKKKKGLTVVNLSKYLNTIQTSVKEIHEAQHLQIVRNYRNDYNDTLCNKIREAEDFIQNKIEPEIDKLWEDSDNQIKAIIDEINKNKNSTDDAIASLGKQKVKIEEMMQLRTALLPLKLAASCLSFFGPIGAGVGVSMTGAGSIAEGMLLDTTSSLGQNKIPSLDPNLKLMSRVTEVFNNKHELVTNKLTEAFAKIEEYKDELSTTQKEKIEISQKIGVLKTQASEIANRKASRISDMERRQKDSEKIEKELNQLINSRKDILEREKKQLDLIKPEQKNVEQLKKEKKYEKSLRRINDVQSTLNSGEIIFSYAKKLDNDQGMINIINNQMSEYHQSLRDLEKMESQIYNIVIPDLRQIEETINAVKNSVDGSSHAKLDITKWTVRTTLKDVKSLLQKFTHKMSFELQSNLKRYVEKIDEGFSILIDIYDRIDSYSDSVKQAEYIAHIVSAPMMNVKVSNSELSNAIIDLRFIIQSNILSEKHEIALHAFKQHYFPFAAHVLQKFELPTGMRFDDIETLRSYIIERIKDMKNHIDESESTIGKYSKYIHEKKIFNSNTTDSRPFYVWKHDTIEDEVQRLLSGSEILLKADISKGLFYNSIKYTDIGINFKLKNRNLQNHFTSVLRNFVLTMTMVGNNYYRCGERYYFISFDDDITISYTLKQDEGKHWIDPNKVYTTIRDSHSFLSPYGMWSIKLNSIDKSVDFEHLKMYTNETIDLELIGQGYYIEQNPDFNFEICNNYLDTFYTVENIVQELV